MRDQNQKKNKAHYNKIYSRYNIHNTLYWLKNLDSFLNTATTTETSWFALYLNDFRNRLRGKKVLEMGCGDCVNAAIMAGLGAEVYANDIATSSGEIIKKLNENYEFQNPIKFVKGDFLKNELPAESFDFVIGKAFLHHLEIPVEDKFLKETYRLLKTGGEARFFEPAVNSRLLDEIRWLIPVKGRPSKLDRKAFREWRENDPHPDRSFSSRHFEKAGSKYFEEVTIVPVGTLERFSRFYKWGKNRNSFKKWALKSEIYIPGFINKALTRSQLIICKKKL
ncbi:class I SAM-dependent methyltransferase [Christiangramia sp. SM2212]|uniref:Methyltransferase domain-containing protein n=1 Tax=Christiangramia sediminicola TaxID=3073267 RepID=A0ABU1EMS9_9FLAO|nr:methyltransferase domain-containing protein [Christiangramia sp. SM2212]MDR5589684.1 methyltransferase domain-containing protein [Christiangramia sp. SM2212]